MSLTTGARLGAYEVLARLGAGHNRAAPRPLPRRRGTPRHV